ncbi:MAG: hypothetical protein AAGK22_29210 [Acidobacteriota bacterium]
MQTPSKPPLVVHGADGVSRSHARAKTMSVEPQAVHLLVALAAKMKAGRGDDDAADAIRERMDSVLRRLPSDQQALLAELSEDLYLLEGKRQVPPLEADKPKDTLRDLAASFSTGDARETLRLLRRVPDDDENWPADKLAYGFGRLWERLHVYEAAAAFYDFAHERNPKSSYGVMSLDALAQAGLAEEALNRIKAIEDSPEAPATLVLKAAATLFQLSPHVSAADLNETYRRIICLVKRPADVSDVLSTVVASAQVAAGFSHEHLGDRDEALQAFTAAVRVKAFDSTLIARGFAYLDRGDGGAALGDFRAAIDLGTALPWPYLHTSHAALQMARWEEAERLAQIGANLSPRGPLRARLLEFVAIAAANLGRADGHVRRVFELAMLDNPFDPTLRKNAAAYEKATTAAALQWDALNPAEARRDFEQSLVAAA